MADAVMTSGIVDSEAAAASRRRLFSRIVIYGLLGLFAIVYIVPLCVVVFNSMRTLPEISKNGLIAFPMSFHLDGWPQAWSSFCIGGQCEGMQRYFWNSVMMVVPAATPVTGTEAEVLF